MNASPPPFGHGLRLLLAFVVASLCLSAPPRLDAADPDISETQRLFIKGEYTKCIRACEEAIADSDTSEDWRTLLARSLLAVGRYTNAFSVISTNLERYPWSVRLRLAGHEVLRRNGQAEEAAAALNEINSLGGYRMWAYQDVANMVTMGKAALLLGADPRRVLEQFFDLAKKRDPASREPYLASGQLALDKHDYDLAAKSFAAGLKKFPDDPDFHFGLAQAYASSDRRIMVASLEALFDQVEPRKRSAEPTPYPQRLRGPVSTFRRLDFDRSGGIGVDDLEALQRPLQIPIRASAVIATLDLNGDGELSLEEFAASMR